MPKLFNGQSGKHVVHGGIPHQDRIQNGIRRNMSLRAQILQ